MKLSKDKCVSFDYKTHTYTNLKSSKKLTSVTTLLSKYKEKFDSEYWSKVIAKRENLTQDEVLKKWKRKAFKSTEIGTAIHKIFEDYVNNNYSIVNGFLEFDYNLLEDEFIIDFDKKKNVALNFINDFFLSKRIIPIETEYICYSDFFAGQIDMICKDNENNFYILDFKTNEEIKTESYNDKRMFGIFEFLPDCSYYHYCLQLSIYKKMLTEYEIKDMYLVHIDNEKYNFMKCINVMDKIELSEII